jgi:hypothetical protein
MPRRATFAILLILTCGGGPAAAELIVPFGPDWRADHDVAVAPDGYAAVWEEGRDVFFRRFGPSGEPLQGPTRLELPDSSITQLALFPSNGDSWVVLAMDIRSGDQIWSVPLDATGRVLAPRTRVAGGPGSILVGLADFAIASDGNVTMLVWVEHILFSGDVVYARALDLDGRPLGERRTVLPVPIQIGLPSRLGVIPSPGGFLCVWDESFIVRARPLKRSGAPHGAVEDVERRPRGPVLGANVASIGAREVVAYFASGPQTEVLGRYRGRNGTYDDPVVLAGPPFQEEPLDGRIDVASAPNRLAMTFVVRTGPHLAETVLVELDADLRRIGPARRIEDELGVSMEATVRWDPYRERWIVFGPGSGPGGSALYLGGLDPAP